MRRSFGMVLFAGLFCLAFNRTASAQSGNISAYPNPFNEGDAISLSISAFWDPVIERCEFGEFDCPEVEADITISGDDEFWFGDAIYYEELGGWGWTTHDVSGSYAMQPISYSADLTVWYYNPYWATAFPEYGYFSTTVQPAAPVIDGGDTVWWFNGENPSGYPTSVTLTSSGGGSTTWAIAGVPYGINLSETSGATTTVTANGYQFSTSSGDVRVIATVGGVSTSHYMTVRTPTYLDPDPADSSDNCPRPGPYSWGWMSDIWYVVRDNLREAMPAVVPVNEWFVESTPWVEWPGGTSGGAWVMPTPNGAGPAITDPSSHLIDRMQSTAGTGVDPNDPTLNCGESVRVDYWHQDWYVGANAIAGTGVFVQGDTQERYRSHGAHNYIHR